MGFRLVKVTVVGDGSLGRYFNGNRGQISSNQHDEIIRLLIEGSAPDHRFLLLFKSDQKTCCICRKNFPQLLPIPFLLSHLIKRFQPCNFILKLLPLVLKLLPLVLSLSLNPIIFAAELLTISFQHINHIVHCIPIQFRKHL